MAYFLGKREDGEKIDTSIYVSWNQTIDLTVGEAFPGLHPGVDLFCR